jgi:hypothetical protein
MPFLGNVIWPIHFPPLYFSNIDRIHSVTDHQLYIAWFQVSEVQGLKVWPLAEIGLLIPDIEPLNTELLNLRTF